MTRGSSSVVAAKSQLRHRIHGSGSDAPMQYFAEIDVPMDDESATMLGPRSSWRAMLVGTLIGLLIVLVLLMKWLMEHQVTAAAERRVQEAAARAAAARCFELASLSAATACRKNLEAKSILAD